MLNSSAFFFFFFSKSQLYQLLFHEHQFATEVFMYLSSSIYKRGLIIVLNLPGQFIK